MEAKQAWKVIHSSKDLDWRTPKSLFDVLDVEFGFTLDAAATNNNKLCSQYLGPDNPNPKLQDALTAHWVGSVYCNPPYGREVVKWVKHGWQQAQQGATVVMLVMACTDTAWWHDFAWLADEIRLVRGRVRFDRADGTPAAAAPKGSAILIFRSHVPPNGWAGGPRVRSWICA
jgi:phage N-6-adenine-methyltransferase